MIETTPSSALERESSRLRIGGALVSVDLPFEIARLRAERAYEQERHAGRALAKYPDLRVVLETMQPGARLPFHETAERITLQVVLGRLRVWLQYGEDQDLAEGSFAAVDAARVEELEALDECAFLLTLAWPPAESGAEGSGSGI